MIFLVILKQNITGFINSNACMMQKKQLTFLEIIYDYFYKFMIASEYSALVMGFICVSRLHGSLVQLT